MTWAVQSFCVIFNIFPNLYIGLGAIGVFKVMIFREKQYFRFKVQSLNFSRERHVEWKFVE